MGDVWGAELNKKNTSTSPTSSKTSPDGIDSLSKLGSKLFEKFTQKSLDKKVIRRNNIGRPKSSTDQTDDRDVSTSNLFPDSQNSREKRKLKDVDSKLCKHREAYTDE